MNLIIPMAGEGKRLRPHTLSVLKPLIPIAGKPIVHRLIEDISKIISEEIENIGFVIGNLEKEDKSNLSAIASATGAMPRFYHQKEAKGTAHAIACAEEILEGRVTVAYADTLFRADFDLNPANDGIIWTKKVNNPNAFGIVKTDTEGIITDFIEHPKKFVSDQAIIGIYYFKEGERLRNEINYLIENNIRGNGEFQLTMALENLKKKGTKFNVATVKEWLDCGDKCNTIKSNSSYLKWLPKQELVHATAIIHNSDIIPPVYIGKNTVIENSIIGPYVSIGTNCAVKNATINESLIQNNSRLENVNFTNSMIGNFVKLKSPTPKSVSLGDYNEW